MTEALYFLDCYLTEFDATVKKVADGKFVVLDRTAFYPEVRSRTKPFPSFSAYCLKRIKSYNSIC